MSLIIFMIVFALVNVGILKYAKRELGNQHISGYIFSIPGYISTIHGCISTYHVEEIRKKLNTRFSRF